MRKKLKILEICPFSAGICGVWTRAFSESIEFQKKGYGVVIFSSDIEKGTAKLAKCEEQIEGINIKRFKSKPNFLSKNVTYFNFQKELLKLINKKQVDIVITHLLHPHSFKALNLCLKYKIPCYLVTHAPFNVKRRFPLNIATWIYYNFKVRPFLNKFTKIIAITKWEIPYLLKLDVKKEKIVYIPNGLPEEFFRQKKSIKPTKDVLFLGRIAPVKNLEVLLESAKLLPNISFSIVGSDEENYLKNLKELIKRENIKNIEFYPPIYNLKEKIKLIDMHKLFVLPSKREAMPQVLLETMARGKIVIASKTDGAKEIIKDKKTGLLFDIGNSEQLANLIKQNIHGNKIIEKNAAKEAEKYSWKKLIKLYPIK